MVYLGLKGTFQDLGVGGGGSATASFLHWPQG